ncbi:hypothetical protein EC951288_3738A, partial [Escherichia coli 95.1288]
MNITFFHGFLFCFLLQFC